MSALNKFMRPLTRFIPPLSHQQSRSPSLIPRTVASSAVQKSIDDLPGNFDLPSHDELIRYVADSVGYFGEKYRVAKQHRVPSPMMKMNLRGLPSVALMSHEAVKQWHKYELEGRACRGNSVAFSKLLGRPFNDMKGSQHVEWRKKAIPSFKQNMVGEMTPFIHQSVENLLLEHIAQATEDGKSVKFCPLAKRFAFEIGSKFVYGPLLSDDERENLFPMFQQWANGVCPKSLGEMLNDPDNPDTDWSAALLAKKSLNEYLSWHHLEAEQLTKTNSWETIYGPDSNCLIRSLMENGGEFRLPDYTLTDRVDSIMFMAFAAYDTSATSMTNMIYSMWQNPEETDKLRLAIDTHPELSDPDSQFTFDMLKSCNELECFINESMRCHGFLSQMASRVINDENGVEIDGVHLPKGTGIIIPLQFLHKGDGSWTDPLEFRPSRFDKSDGSKKTDRGGIGAYNHIPFATGLHKCLGQHLAMLEMRMYTVLLLRDWEFELDESRLDEDGTVNHLNLSQSFPHYNVYLKLKRRQKISHFRVA